MEIRPAFIADLEKIRFYDRHISEKRLEACIREQQIYVLCNGTQIIGVLRWSLFWQSIPFLDLLYLDAADRGKGWGSRMMRYWETAMAAQGYRYGMVSTQEDETAKYFYEKLGYRRIGAFLPPEQEADELLYLKTLENEGSL